MSSGVHVWRVMSSGCARVEGDVIRGACVEGDVIRVCM